MDALSWIQFGLGALIVAGAILDLFLTALTARGGGPVMGAVSRAAWRVLLAVHHRRPSHSLLTQGGWSICLLLALVWLGLLWAGWSVLFTSAERAVVESAGGAPADLVARVYFAGYTVSTLGLGDFKPGGPLWQIAAAVASASGLLVATMILTYLVPVVGAVAGKRKLAACISALGHTPETLLARNWDGQGLRPLEQHLTSLLPMLVETAQQYSVYPVLHYFHAGEPDHALPLRVAALNDALLIHDRLPASARLPRGIVEPVKRAVDRLLDNIDRSGFRLPSAEVPPPDWDAEALAAAGLPAPEPGEAPSAEEDRRRARLAAWIRRDGWSWDDIKPVDDPCP